MKKEQEVLLSIIRSTITNEKISFADVDMNNLIKESILQSVLPMVYDILKNNGIELEGMAEQYAFLKIAGNMKVGYCQQQLIELLDKNGFPYVILKGEAAAAYYPRPDLRALGDVDFLIEFDQREQVTQMLLDAGYIKHSEGHICHVVFRKPDAHLEMHFEVAGIPNKEAGKEIRAFMKDTVRHYTEKDIGNGKFRAPEDIYHGIILLLHMQHHMLGEGIGLRHLCDWAYFIYSTSDMPFWNDLVPFLSEIGLLYYASVMSNICALYFGIPCPSWAEVVSDELCRDVIEDIFDGGNFGKKDAARVQGSVLISNRGKDGMKHGKLFYLFYALNAYVKEKYYKWKNVYILYPIFYILAGIRYIHSIIVGKRAPLHKLYRAAEKRKNIYEKLHIFETE